MTTIQRTIYLKKDGKLVPIKRVYEKKDRNGYRYMIFAIGKAIYLIY